MIDDMTPSGGASTMPEFPWEILQKPFDKDRFIQECAIKLFTNTDFSHSTLPISVIAKDSVNKAKALANALKLK